jgi:LPPG:FO 2-phospho-L-lactate transferase
MDYEHIVILTGGTGTVKLINGFYEIVPDKLSIVTNTADDFSFYGIYVSPDTDAVLYSLSGLLDKTKMWGLSQDSFTVKDILKNLDTDTEFPVASWFNLGDKDLAHCLYRTFLLEKGKSLTEAVAIISNKLNISAKIYPMADSPVGTYFTTTDDEEFHLEEFFIRLRTEPAIKSITIKGAEDAKVSKELIQEIKKADLIIIGPSNPISSIGPILKINSIFKEMKENTCPKLVISPIIGVNPVSGPAHKYMEASGFEVSPLGVYKFYENIGTHFMFDTSDKVAFKDKLERKSKESGHYILFEDILIPTKEKQVELAEKIVKIIK